MLGESASAAAVASRSIPLAALIPDPSSRCWSSLVACLSLICKLLPTLSSTLARPNPLVGFALL